MKTFRSNGMNSNKYGNKKKSKRAISRNFLCEVVLGRLLSTSSFFYSTHQHPRVALSGTRELSVGLQFISHAFISTFNSFLALKIFELGFSFKI